MLDADASVPSGVTHQAFVATPLTTANAALDYAAYMASPDVIRVHSDSRWTVEGFTLEEDRDQVAMHQAAQEAHRAFTFLLLDPTESESLGSFGSGPEEEAGGLFVTTGLAQSAPFAEQLRLEMLPSGCVRVDALGRTSRPGIYAAGDLAHVASLPMPLASVLNAASAGLLAATAADQDLVADDNGLPPMA